MQLFLRFGFHHLINFHRLLLRPDLTIPMQVNFPAREQTDFSFVLEGGVGVLRDRDRPVDAGGVIDVLLGRIIQPIFEISLDFITDSFEAVSRSEVENVLDRFLNDIGRL